MEYERTLHLPQQVENLMNAYAQGDVNLLERIRKNICDIITNDDFQKVMKEYDSERIKKFNELLEKSADALKTILEAKNLDELFIDIEEIKLDLQKATETVEAEYWDTIKTYILSYIETIDKDG